ncbi:tautomerase family protein [Streptomyces sp. NPDC058232]|uniref:tautomerase family protein n=1 Tax=unclassified Streptomyces TaxID=2593676 RepID=UPI0036ED0507
MSRNQEISDACWLAHRTLEDKRKVTVTINRRDAEALGISPDDIFISLISVSNENFSFGRGELQLAEDAPNW